MRLTMKERGFTIRDSFRIQDENGKDKYQVIGTLIKTGTFRIKDMSGKELARIEQKFISLKRTFHLVIGGKRVGDIVRDGSFLGDKYHVTGYDWEVKGDIFDHRYSIFSNLKTIVSVKKKRLALTDTYVFDIEDEADEIPALATVLAIDYIASIERMNKRHKV